MKKILSISGGGTRGLIAATILKAIEGQWREQRQDRSLCLSDRFDLIAGTSTGAVIALGLTRTSPATATGRRRDAAYMAELYLTRSREIFAHQTLGSMIPGWRTLRGGPKYKADALEKLLQEEIGDEPMYSDGAGPKVLVASFSMTSYQPWFFKSYGTSGDPYGPEDKRQERWKVARASSAAPTFFPPFELQSSRHGEAFRKELLVDGGLSANNPTICAIVDALNLWPGERLLVVSVGTGTPKDLGVKAPDANVSRWSPLQWISFHGKQPIIDALMNGNEQTTTYQLGELEKLKAWKTYRFDIDLETTMPLDLCDPESLARYAQDAEAYCATKAKSLIADLAGEL